MVMISLTEQREKIVDASFPFYFDALGFVAPLPKELPKWQAVYRPFLGQVWVGVIALIIISGPTYWLLQTKSLKPTDQNLRIKLVSTSMYFISLILRNSTKDKLEVPKQASSKILLVSWLIFSIVISAAYTGNLISFMTYPGIENPINTAEDILTSGYDIKIYNYGGSETAAFEATQTLPIKMFGSLKL